MSQTGEAGKAVFTPVGQIGSDLPFKFEHWQALAEQNLPRGPYDYAAGGSGAEQTMRSNRDAFARWEMAPRVLRNVRERSLHVEVLGRRYRSPLMLAPIGMQQIVHPEGELATARAAAQRGIPFALSTVASHTIEAVAEEMGDAPKWFQLYWSNDREISASMVRRAEQAGYEAIIVTVDTIILGWKQRDLANGYSPLKLGMGMANYAYDPVFAARYGQYPEITTEQVVAGILENVYHPGLTYEDLQFLRQQTNLPIWVKGVLRGDDALLCMESGMDGIIVSNHGGRQLDGAVSALDALVEVRAAVGSEVPVLMDSGIRSGADCLKALALGADAVMIGRPFLFALGVDGERGVGRMLDNLLAELDISLALSGCQAVAELDVSLMRSVSRTAYVREGGY